LIVLESEGGSKTYRTFTIDREDISGVETIAVEEKNTNTSGSYYRAMYGANKEIKVVRGITNTLATLNWNNKNSGAKITAEYYYAPFVQDSTVELREMNVGGHICYFDNYQKVKNEDLIKALTNVANKKYVEILKEAIETGKEDNYEKTDSLYKKISPCLTEYIEEYVIKNKKQILEEKQKRF
jgi:hypothetical protein